jgi:hypothetical protein
MQIDGFVELASNNALKFNGERIKEVYCDNIIFHHRHNKNLSCDLNCDEQRCPFLIFVGSDTANHYQPYID